MAWTINWFCTFLGLAVFTVYIIAFTFTVWILQNVIQGNVATSPVLLKSFEEIIMYKYLFGVRVQQRWECASFTLFARGIWLQRRILGWPVRDGNHLRTSSALSVSILCGSLWGRLMSELRVPRPTKKQFNLVRSSHGSGWDLEPRPQSLPCDARTRLNCFFGRRRLRLH